MLLYISLGVVLTVACVVYLVTFFGIARRFAYAIVRAWRNTELEQRLSISRKAEDRIDLSIMLFGIVIGYMVAIPMYIRYRIVDNRIKRQRAFEEAEFVRKQKTEEEKRRELNEHNTIRAREREEWFKNQHGVSLHYNTLCGITAVLTDADLISVGKQTLCAEEDGFWTVSGLFVLSPQTMVFLTVSGRNHIEQTLPEYLHPTVFDHKGFLNLSTLKQFCRDHNIELVHQRSIFVPFVNSAIVSFDRQVNTVPSMTKYTMERLLIELAPESLRPVSKID